MSRNRTISSLTGAVAALIATASFSHARPLDDVVKSGFIDIAVYADFAPYSWTVADGKPAGIDVDIAIELAKSIGVEPRFMVRIAGENLDADLRSNIWRGDIVDKKMADVMMHVPQDKGLIAAVPGELEPRNDLVFFCCGYHLEKFAVVADPEIIKANTFAPFVRRKIAVEVDTVPDFFLSAAFGGQLMNSIVRTRTFDGAMKAFDDGEVTAVMATQAQTEWIVKNTKRQTKLLHPPTPGIVREDWPVGIAVRTDSRDLGYQFGLELEKLAATGRLKDIMAAYGVTYVPVPIRN
jgi:ABC-type amino acid transport substrate-binding protein